MYANPRDTKLLVRPSNENNELVRSTDNRRVVLRLSHLKCMGAAGFSSARQSRNKFRAATRFVRRPQGPAHNPRPQFRARNRRAGHPDVAEA